jgi:hypothetical protein
VWSAARRNALLVLRETACQKRALYRIVWRVQIATGTQVLQYMHKITRTHMRVTTHLLYLYHGSRRSLLLGWTSVRGTARSLLSRHLGCQIISQLLIAASQCNSVVSREQRCLGLFPPCLSVFQRKTRPTKYLKSFYMDWRINEDD